MDPPEPSNSGLPEARIAVLIDEYFDRRHRGEEISPGQFLALYPDDADTLRPYLIGAAVLDRAKALAGSAAAEPAVVQRLPKIAGYELTEELGRGGMGVVYRALQRSTRRTVAVKVMLAGPFASPQARRRFTREVRLAARLQHERIVRVLESDEVEGQPYYSMEYVAGPSLGQYLLDQQPDLSDLLQLFIELIEAVEYAHTHGVIHRDLKPGNVLIDADDHPHILDFGLAKAIDDSAQDSLSLRVSTPGQVVGTLFYLSPEQAAGRSEQVDARTDVYALGVMLYEALTGSLPFDTGAKPSEVLEQIIEAAPTPPSALSRGIGRDLETIVLKALHKDRTRRYASAGDLAEDLRRFMAGEPIQARRPSSLYVLRKKLVKHRLRVGAVAAVIAVGLVGGMLHLGATARQTRHDRAAVVRYLHDLEIGATPDLIGEIRAVYLRRPDLHDAGLAMAQALYRQEGTRERAHVFLEQRLRREPQAWGYLSLLAEVYANAGQTDRATGLRQRAEQIAPDTAEGWYLRSLATLDRGRAGHCAEQCVQRDPIHTLAWQRLARLRLLAGDWNGAAEAADQLIQLGEPAAKWLVFKANLCVRDHRYDDAIGLLTRVLAMPRSHSGPAERRAAYWARAAVHRHRRDFAAAVADYSTLMARHPNDSKLAWDYYQRATPLWILGRREEALADYERASVLLGRPLYGDARRVLILRELDRPAEADQVLSECLAKAEDLWLRQIFRCLAGLVGPEELVADARARGHREHLCEACYYAGEICLADGRPEDARRWFEQCIQTRLEFDPTDATLTPMNEYELARWRFTRLADPGHLPQSGKN